MPTNTTPTIRTYMSPKQPADGDNKTPTPARKRRYITKKSLPWLLVLVLIVVSLLLFWQYKQAQSKLNGGAKDAVKVQQQVKKLIFLPTNETPTVATVNDVTKVRNQTFFKDAQNGDKVLIYPQLHKAILYRPSTNMLINVQTVNLSQPNNPTVTPQ